MSTLDDPWDEGDAKRLRSTEELREGAFCEYVCEVLQAMPIQYGKFRVLVVTDYTENPHLPNFDSHKATTPQGKRSIRVTLWDEHAFSSLELGVEPGCFVLLKNAVPKCPRMSPFLEVVLHGTRSYQRVKPRRSVVILEEHHQLVRELLNRKSIYEASLRGDSISGRYHSVLPGLGSSSQATKIPATAAPSFVSARTLPEATPISAAVAHASSSTASPSPIPPQEPAAPPPTSTQALATTSATTTAITQATDPRSSGVLPDHASPLNFSQAVREPVSGTAPPSPPVSKGLAFTSNAAMDEYASEFISPPPATPEAHRRLSSTVKRESLSPVLNRTNLHQPSREPSQTPQTPQQHEHQEHGHHITHPPALEMPVIAPQQEPRRLAIQKPKQLNKIRIRGRGCRGEPQMRYEFSIVVLDEFNQELVIQVPSSVAAMNMGMADPCNWINKPGRYKEACEALAKFDIFDKTPQGMMTNSTHARPTLVDFDIVVSLVRPPNTLPLQSTPSPVPFTTAPLTNAAAGQASSSTNGVLSHTDADEIEWSSTRKRLFQNEVPRVKRKRTDEPSSPSSSSSSSTTSSARQVAEYIMELVSIKPVSPPEPQPTIPQERNRSPSAPPKHHAPKHHTPKPPDRRRR
ncbi:hypothetical protein BGZ73_005835 [Actinomortierella ambigua]|nr:hypothetical protein BGZ73_005835 [Actinomortierella ambigua]